MEMHFFFSIPFPCVSHLVDKPRAGTNVANNGPSINIFFSLVCPGVCLHTVSSRMCHCVGVGVCFYANVCKYIYARVYSKMEIIDVIVGVIEHLWAITKSAVNNSHDTLRFRPSGKNNCVAAHLVNAERMHKACEYCAISTAAYGKWL